MSRRIFLVTPLRDEIENIDRLFQSVAAQDAAIELWIIVENGSTDGSREELGRRNPPPNVNTLVVLNVDTEQGEYALGAKYARIVNRGFSEIRRLIVLANQDLIGILDADSFPEPSYYSALSTAFDENPKLGIAGGLSRDDGTRRPSVHSSEWVRGSCRLWRGACMLQSGYTIGPSADTLSLARAEIDGWQASVVPGAVYVAREVGSRAKHRYYGYSTWFRGNSFIYACLRALRLLVRGNLRAAYEYFMGYIGSFVRGTPRIEDPELRACFASYLTRKLRRRLRRG